MQEPFFALEAIGNDFLNGSTDLGVIVAVAVAGALVVFFNGQKGK